MNPVIDCQEHVPSPSSLKNLVAPLSPVDNIAVPSGVALIVCQLLSPLKNLVLTELPDPSLATLTVPELRFDAFKAVKLAPLAAGRVAGNLASGTVPAFKFEADPAVNPPDVPEQFPVTLPVTFPVTSPVMSPAKLVLVMLRLLLRQQISRLLMSHLMRLASHYLRLLQQEI